MSRRPVQSLVIFHKLQVYGPMRTPDLAREVGTPTVCMRALLSYLARRPTPLVERVRPGVWQASRHAPEVLSIGGVHGLNVVNCVAIIP